MKILRAIFGGVREIRPDNYQTDFYHNDSHPHILLDVRKTNEYDSGHIDGAINIPLNKLPKKLGKLPKDQEIVIVSHSGDRGREAAFLLKDAGYKEVANLVGGILAWRRDGGELIS